MRVRTVLRWLGGVVVGVAVLAGLGTLAFFPFPEEPGYEFVASWGGKGTAPGTFNDPTGIAVTGEEVFVADSRNGRIQVFNRDGEFLRAFSSPGDRLGELGRPMNLTIQGTSSMSRSISTIASRSSRSTAHPSG